MSIFKRADGRWCVKTKDESCPGKYIQKTFKTQEEAKEYENRFIPESPRQSNRLSVQEAVEFYLENKQLCDVLKEQYIWLISGPSKNSKRAKIKEGYAEGIAKRYVDTLTRADLQRVRNNARAAGAGNVSINMWTRRLQAAFNYAVEEDMLLVNPWARYHQLPARHKNRPGTLEDFHRIYGVLPEWMQWACRTAMALCLRPGRVELFSLRWSAFNFQHGSVAVYMGKVGRTKTVYPPEEYMSEAKARFEATGGNLEGLVCPNAKGKFAASYRATLQRARRKAGVKEFSLYALRHIVASHQLAEGADIAAVAANLGHSNPQTTLRTYAHALPKAQRDAAASIGAIWCKKDQ